VVRGMNAIVAEIEQLKADYDRLSKRYTEISNECVERSTESKCKEDKRCGWWHHTDSHGEDMSGCDADSTYSHPMEKAYDKWADAMRRHYPRFNPGNPNNRAKYGARYPDYHSGLPGAFS